MKAVNATASSALALTLMLAGPAAIAADEGMDSGQSGISGSDQTGMSGMTGMSGSGQTGMSGMTGTSGSDQTGMSGMSGMSGSDKTGMSGEGVRVDELTGSKIVNDSGEEIGEVKKVVRGKHDGKAQAVVSVGGMFGLGLGDKEVLMPLNELRMDGDKLRAPKDSANTEDQLERLPSYDGARFEEVSGDKTVSLGSGGMSTHQGGGSASGH